VDVLLLDLHVGAVFRNLLRHLCSEILLEFGFGYRGFFKKGHLFYYVISFQTVYFLHKSMLYWVHWRPPITRLQG
jgi:hypothetical protein